MNRSFWWVVAVIVVVLAVGASLKRLEDRVGDSDESPSPSVSVSVSPSPSGGTSGNGGTTGTGPVGSKTYTTLVAQYGSNRIQFDKLCQAIPSNPVFKTGTYVMFDNRSGDARTINIGGTNYYFPGYGYRIIKLGSTKLPATVNLNCGSALHVGTITVEK